MTNRTLYERQHLFSDTTTQAGPVDTYHNGAVPLRKEHIEALSQNNSAGLQMVYPPRYQEFEAGLRKPPLPLRSSPQQSAWQSHSTETLSWPQKREWVEDQPRRNTSDVLVSRPHAPVDCPIARGVNQGVALCDRVATRLNEVLARAGPVPGMSGSQDDLDALARGLALDDATAEYETTRQPSAKATKIVAKEKSGGVINFKKTWLYRNSRLPPGMLPFKIYLPSWTLLCRAAQASHDVYQRPRRDQREYYTDADPRKGTKAMVVRSQPVDDKHLVVIAIRGSQWKLVDWTTNAGLTPTQPVGFLDDEGNACHSGFLHVARSMIGPIAERLRDIIRRELDGAQCSLLFTGHSAGGAVASLLYMHMLAQKVSSDLTDLRGLFRRIHCVTFGVPPLSLLPLQPPEATSSNKNMFLSLVNEGDPVVRADWAYVKSLARLVAAPAPSSNGARPTGLRTMMSRQKLVGDNTSASRISLAPRWPVPEATLSSAGRLVLLREKVYTKTHAIEAVQVTDEELRDVIFGDPSMHAMELYKRRVDNLAFAAVSGRDEG